MSKEYLFNVTSIELGETDHGYTIHGLINSVLPVTIPMDSYFEEKLNQFCADWVGSCRELQELTIYGPTEIERFTKPSRSVSVREIINRIREREMNA